MSRATKSLTGVALVLFLLTALLVGGLAASADEPEAKGNNLDYYMKTKVYYCTSDIICFHPDVLIRCKAGDFATGGAAWMTDNPSGQPYDYLSRPWRKNGAARGWEIPTGGTIDPGDWLTVQVICKRN